MNCTCEEPHVTGDRVPGSVSLVRSSNETKYSRVDQVKFCKGFLPQILFGPLLNTLYQIVVGGQ